MARRYAAALYAQAKKADKVVPVGEELALISGAIARTGFLRALLNQPTVTDARKKAALKSAIGATYSPLSLGLLYPLIDKRRIDLLPAVEEEFARLVLEYRNIAHATATSAVPLTPDQVRALERSLETRTGKDIELEMAVDPSLIGGILVRIGDTVLDGTVKGNLERLREQFLVRK